MNFGLERHLLHHPGSQNMGGFLSFLSVARGNTALKDLALFEGKAVSPFGHPCILPGIWLTGMRVVGPLSISEDSRFFE